MGWGEPVQSTGYIKWDIPKVIAGVYLGGEEKMGKNEKPNTQHTIAIDREETVFWGTVILNDLLSQVGKGTLVQIEYTGERQTANGRLKEFVVRPWVEDTAESVPF